ncbi:histidine kinase N-terminal 7TM domain-containing protein [Candidatus Margulisiibacteriota bacterium]
MNYYVIPPLITGFLIIFFGIFVLARNLRGRNNFAFFTITLSMFIWLFCFSGMYMSPNPSQALLWARIGFLGVIFIPITAFHFFATLANLANRKRVLFFLYLLAIPSLLISFSTLIYADVTKYFWGYYPVAGRLYFLFMLMFISLFGLGVAILFRAYRQAVNEKNYLKTQQFKYVFLAFACAITGLMDYVIKYKVVFYPFGYISAFFFIFLIAYAVVKHRLMNITFVIRKGLIYSVVISLFSGIYLSVVFILGQLIRGFVQVNPFLITIAGIIAFAFAFQPLRDKTQEIIDKIFFKGRYDYQKTLKDLSQTASSIVDPEELLAQTTNTIAEAMKVSDLSVYLFDNNKNCFVRK